jgi:hypothetical protein
MRSPASGLAINRLGDIHEQEADRVADTILRMPATETMAWGNSTSSQNHLQRTCAKCEEEDGKLQRKCASCEEEDKVHRSATGNGPAKAPSIVHDVLRSPGQMLDPGTRAFMEPRFGHDFANVRVHTDEKAASSARAVNASAYTVGNNIVFDSGRFNSNSMDGRRLLAHELTHVVQQSAGRGPGILARQPADDQKPKATDNPPPKAPEEQKPQQAAPKAAKCDTGCAQRWGQDTTCSKWGFKQGTHEVGAGKNKKTADCCNSWPFAVEKHAREDMKINGAASCTVRHEREIATVSMGSKSVQVLCSDTIPNAMFGGTDNAKDCDGDISTEVLEMSPKAMEDLSGQTTNALHVTVCYSGTKEDLCLHNGPGKARSPEQTDCLTRGCDAPADTPKLKDTGWPVR